MGLKNTYRQLLSPEGPASWKGTPFAVDTLLLNIRFDSVIVPNLESCDVRGRLEEKTLAMTSVLQYAVESVLLSLKSITYTKEKGGKDSHQRR